MPRSLGGTGGAIGANRRRYTQNPVGVLEREQVMCHMKDFKQTVKWECAGCGRHMTITIHGALHGNLEFAGGILCSPCLNKFIDLKKDNACLKEEVKMAKEALSCMKKK